MHKWIVHCLYDWNTQLYNDCNYARIIDNLLIAPK